MRTAVFVGVICLLECHLAGAATAPPLESLLQRAETIVLARVTAITEESVTLRLGEVLRGEIAGALVLGFGGRENAGWGPRRLKVGEEFLLLSQGDARFGGPRPILGRPMHGQHQWCGWTPLPMVRDRGGVYAGAIFSFADGQPSDDGQDPKDPKLSLARVKRLLDRFPYDPHANDNA